MHVSMSVVDHITQELAHEPEQFNMCIRDNNQDNSRGLSFCESCAVKLKPLAKSSSLNKALKCNWQWPDVWG